MKNKQSEQKYVVSVLFTSENPNHPRFSFSFRPCPFLLLHNKCEFYGSLTAELRLLAVSQSPKLILAQIYFIQNNG